MTTHTDIDNRNIEEMNAYLEARVEALQRAVLRLEKDNADLARELATVTREFEEYTRAPR